MNYDDDEDDGEGQDTKQTNKRLTFTELVPKHMTFSSISTL